MQSTSNLGDELPSGSSHDTSGSPNKPTTPPRSTSNAPQSGSTPIVNHRANSNQYKVVQEDLDSRTIALFAEIAGRVVGPVSVEDFNTFLPPIEIKGKKPDGKAAFEKLKHDLDSAEKEVDMYEPLIEYFKTLCSSRLNFRNDSSKVLKVFESQEIKPDINVYQSENEHKAREAMFEVKFKNDYDPFDDELDEFVKSSNDGGKRTLGQITGYATCHQAMEFRTHVFSALIFRTYMRLLRWDRGGVVVTEKIEFDDVNLFEFFHRFSTVDSAQRGRDPTVRPAILSSHELEMVRSKLGRKLSNKDLLEISVGQKKYIISKDQSLGSTSPIGRSTRCFKACSLKEGELVLLKDSWRVLAPTLRPEHEIYARLHENQVQNIPKVYHGADIGEDDDCCHTTQTKQWVERVKKELTLVLRTLRHYRIVLQYLEYELEQFDEVRELIIATRDAAIAHDDAFTEAKVLHRDISAGNIMFNRNKDGQVRGYLIDWDLSLDLTLDETAVAQEERTGTWQFLAIRLLSRPIDGRPLIQNQPDDIESFYHVLTWMALRCTAHSLEPSDLTELLESNFNGAYEDYRTGRKLVSSTRLFAMTGGGLIQKAGFSNEGIFSILSQMREVLGYRYLELNRKRKNKAELVFERKKQEQALKDLEQPKWLPNLLNELLADKEIDWSTNKNRVDHVLLKRPRTFNDFKRKTETSIHSDTSNKVPRGSHTSTPHGRRSGDD